MIRLKGLNDTIKNNTKMIKITQKQQKILAVLIKGGSFASSQINEEVLKNGEDVSLVTIKRELSKMVNLKLIAKQGFGPATNYQISAYGRINTELEARVYCATEPDNRHGQTKYNFEILPVFAFDLFSSDELKNLKTETMNYNKRSKNISETLEKKELERLVIELSWKSSKIEGNTYTLLDTEKLILENKEAVGHSKNEAQMILNHKDAFNFVFSNKKKFRSLNLSNLEQLHKLLVKGLDVGFGLRKKPVGILGSKYRPLDNVYQIEDAIKLLSKVIAKNKNPYAKALISLLSLSYVQPFEDGNKRASRLMCNAILMAYGLAPLSYRSVNENDYREAMIVFYETNSIIPFKKIFIEQYIFAAQNYLIK
jgi:fido (protein-threonine AMPylation protein)